MNTTNLITRESKVNHNHVFTGCYGCTLAKPVIAMEGLMLPLQPEYQVKNAILHGGHMSHQQSPTINHKSHTKTKTKITLLTYNSG